MLHIWTTVTYLSDGGYISVRLLHIWTMDVTYLDDCYISGRWRLHIWTTVSYLDDGGYIFGRPLHIWTMEVTYLDDCYISGRWRLYIWTTVTYLHVTRLHNDACNCAELPYLDGEDNKLNAGITVFLLLNMLLLTNEARQRLHDILPVRDSYMWLGEASSEIVVSPMSSNYQSSTSWYPGFV